jgi:hypothetical protein
MLKIENSNFLMMMYMSDSIADDDAASSPEQVQQH